MQTFFWRVVWSGIVASLVVGTASTSTNAQSTTFQQPLPAETSSFNWAMGFVTIGTGAFMLFFGPVCLGFVSVKEMGLLVEQKIEGQENAESALLLEQSPNNGKRQDILDVQELLDP